MTTAKSLPAPAPLSVATIAARAERVSKSYGVGDARVCALDDVTVGIRGGEFTAIMGPSRLRQIHAAARARGPRPADLRRSLHRRHRDHPAGRQGR